MWKILCWEISKNPGRTFFSQWHILSLFEVWCHCLRILIHQWVIKKYFLFLYCKKFFVFLSFLALQNVCQILLYNVHFCYFCCLLISHISLKLLFWLATKKRFYFITTGNFHLAIGVKKYLILSLHLCLDLLMI